MRFFGVQNPSWSVTKKVPSGFRQTPFAARKPVARISVFAPSVLTFSSVPWCGTNAGRACRPLLA